MFQVDSGKVFALHFVKGGLLQKLGFEDTQQERSFIGVKASYARKKGIELKKLQRKPRSSKIDWSGLAELAKSVE